MSKAIPVSARKLKVGDLLQCGKDLFGILVDINEEYFCIYWVGKEEYIKTFMGYQPYHYYWDEAVSAGLYDTLERIA